MKRYDIILGWGGALMQERADGDYVRFEDVAALLAVAEAARGVELSAGMPAPHVEIKDTDTFEIQLTGKEVAGLLNALARLDGEVG